MAEFPYPEYRNLWRGSKLSMDRSAVAKSSYLAWEQTDEGLEFTAVGSPTDGNAFSYLYTNTAFRVATKGGKAYSWSFPVKNTGSVTVTAKMTSYLSPSGTNSASATLAPGESKVIKIENIVAPSDGDIRFSWRADTDVPLLPVGAKLTILDGISIVQSETASPFPFNGDGIFPVETLKRRNLALSPSFETSPISGVTVGSSEIGFSSVTTTNTVAVGERSLQARFNGSYANPASSWIRQTSNLPITPGDYVAMSAYVRRGSNGTSETLQSRMHFATRQEDNTYIVTSYGPLETLNTAEMTYRGDSHPAYRMSSFKAPDNAALLQAGISFAVDGSVTGLSSAEYIFTDAWVVASAPTQAAAEAAVATYFDGDSPASGNLVYRYAPDGTSLEIEVAQPPEGRTAIWDGPVGSSTSTLWVGDTAYATGVMEIGASTEARLGIVSDVYSRSREKIALELARVDSQLIAGERVELDAAAMTASPVVWHWRQITGPAVELEPREASMDFIAPDVDEDTPLRIAVYAASEDGRNRSDWHYFDLTIKPPIARFRATEGAFSPVSPKYVGYDRGKREVWNDVIPPSGFSPSPRHEVEIIDLGIVPDDVQFTTGGPPERAAAGGIYVDLETGDIYRNFGAGYNETDDTTAAPRTNAWWVNPATGDILEWIED